MGSLTPQSPLMQPIGPIESLIMSMDTVYDSEYDMVHAANLAKRILCTSDYDELESLLRECVEITSRLCEERDATYFVYMCIQSRLGQKLQRVRQREESFYGKYEKSMYVIFQKNPQKYIPGSIITTHKKVGPSRPDFFLEVRGIFSVAEFKANPFRYRDLYQLQEYMTRYKATQGYAVAPSVLCDLPVDVHFVRMFPVIGRNA